MLASVSVYKVGVGVAGDAARLLADYSVYVQSWVDIRHLLTVHWPHTPPDRMGLGRSSIS